MQKSNQPIDTRRPQVVGEGQNYNVSPLTLPPIIIATDISGGFCST